MSKSPHERPDAVPAPRPTRASRRGIAVLVTTFVCCMLVGAVAYGATNWIVTLQSVPASKAQAQAGSTANLTITATATPAAANTVYPGGYGDAVVTIQNTGTVPVTITALNLPTSTTFAAGYTTSALTTTNACTASVSWRFATTTSGTSHTLTTPLIVGASATLTVTFTNDITMNTTAPAACASSWFKMPSFTAITASAGGTTPTVSPATSGWTA
jgi:hypothetical protein